MARYRITIGTTEYPCERWETVERPRTLKESWRDGWVGGMGEYLRRHRDTYYISSNFDTSTYPFVRLRPLLANKTTIKPKATNPMYAWVAEDSNSVEYLYIFGTGGSVAELTKMKLSDHSLVEETSFAANSVAGRPAFFNGVAFLPLGDSVDARKITTVSTGASDSFGTLTGDKALAFVVLNDEATAKIARAHTTNKVDFSSTGSTGSWQDDFEVGDTTLGINDMINFQGELLISKPDGPWRFGGVQGDSIQGQAYPVIDFVGRTPSLTGELGATMASMGGFAYWPHTSGIWRIFGQSAKPIDPMARPDFVGQALDTITPSFYGQWDSIAIWGRWIYATNQTDLFYGYIQEDGTVTWHGILVNSGQFIRCFIVTGEDDGPSLWVASSNGTVTVERIELQDDGSVRKILTPGSGRGAASLTAQMWMPIVDFGESNVAKQLSYMAGEFDNIDSDTTVTFRVHRDRAFSSEVVGSSFTSGGLQEQSWTAGTNDTFREVMAGFRFVTAAGYSNKDPRCRSLTIVAVTPYVYKAVLPIDQDNMRDFSSSVESAHTVLTQLNSGASISVRPPGFNAPFTGYLVNVRERTTGTETGPGVSHEMEITIRRWVV